MSAFGKDFLDGRVQSFLFVGDEGFLWFSKVGKLFKCPKVLWLIFSIHKAKRKKRTMCWSRSVLRYDTQESCMYLSYMYSQYQSSTKSVGLVGWLRGEQRILIELFHWSQSWNNKTIHKYIESESNWWLLISLQVQSSKPSSLGL